VWIPTSLGLFVANDNTLLIELKARKF